MKSVHIIQLQYDKYKVVNIILILGMHFTVFHKYNRLIIPYTYIIYIIDIKIHRNP